MVEPRGRQKTVVMSLHQLDIHTPWCIHQSQIASLATNMASRLHQIGAIALLQQQLAALVLKLCRLRAAINLGFGNQVDQKVDPQLLGHIHSPMLWPPVDYHLQLAGHLEETANLRSHSIRLSIRWSDSPIFTPVRSVGPVVGVRPDGHKRSCPAFTK